MYNFRKKLSYYCAEMNIDFTGATLQLKKLEGKTLVCDPIRKKWLVLTPEEHVRQYLLQYLIHVMQYPPALIAVEKTVLVNGQSKRYDVVVYNRNHSPWLLAECKAPDIPVSNATLQQLLRYHNNLQCSYWLVTNGHTTFCANATDTGNVAWMDALPVYDG